jgi:hypothetical protein
MCKLLWGLVFLVVLALELFFNRLRNGWLHTVRMVFWGEGWRNGGQVGLWWFCFWSVFGLTRNPSIYLVLADNLNVRLPTLLVSLAGLAVSSWMLIISATSTYFFCF